MAITNFVKNIRNIMRNDAGINGDAQRIEQIAWMLFLKVYDEKENDWEFNEDNYTSFIPEVCRWRNWAKDDGTGEAMTADKLLKQYHEKRTALDAKIDKQLEEIENLLGIKID